MNLYNIRYYYTKKIVKTISELLVYKTDKIIREYCIIFNQLSNF